MSDAIRTSVPDLNNVGDITRTLQGHVGQNIEQRFTIERQRVLTNDRLKLQCREFIIKDQFGNLYVMFLAELMDREVYSVADWVGSEVWRGAGKVIKLVGEYKQFRRFDDDMLAFLQDKAFVAFGRATVAILKARQAGKQPLVPLNDGGASSPAYNLSP